MRKEVNRMEEDRKGRERKSYDNRKKYTINKNRKR